jgi:hypothetical protein
MILGQVVGPALHNALDPAASQAASIAWLWWIFFWTTVAVCVGFAIAVFRKRTVEDAANDKRAEQIVGILVAIVVLILLGLLGADFVTDRAIASVGRAQGFRPRVDQGHRPSVVVGISLPKLRSDKTFFNRKRDSLTGRSGYTFGPGFRRRIFTRRVGIGGIAGEKRGLAATTSIVNLSLSQKH